MYRALLVAAVAVSACAELPSRNVSEFPPEPRPSLSKRDHTCLSEAIYFEAGSKGEPGRRAVAHVILNRVASDAFPDNICSVIQEGQDKDACQFSYRCDLDYSRFIYPDQLRRARATARAVLGGDSKDPTGGALFFHADYAAPGPWFSSLQRIGNFGGNIFYL